PIYRAEGGGTSAGSVAPAIGARMCLWVGRSTAAGGPCAFRVSRSCGKCTDPLPGLARASGAGHAHFRQIRRAGAMPSLYWYPPQTGGFSMKHFATIVGATLLAAALPGAASSAAPLEECVQLSEAHRGTRANGNRQLLLRDDEAHYRVSFGRTCETLARSSRIFIATDGEHNRL